MNASVEDLDLSNDILKILELSITIPLHGMISCIGLISNLLCMVVLFQMGATKKSMNIGVFALSLTDFLVTGLQLSICLCFLVRYLYPGCVVDMWVMGTYILGWIRYAGFFMSAWITTLLSVERCLCVVIPFTWKKIFTKSRCVIAVLFIYVMFIALVTPIYIYQKLDWETNNFSTGNGTWAEKRVLTVRFTEQTAELEKIIDLIGTVTLSLLSQVILILCSAWMISALKTSSEVRRASPVVFRFTSANVHTRKTSLSYKERKLFKVVTCLALILIVCNLPRYAEIATYHLVPGMNVGRYKNLAGFLWDLSDLFGTLNCSSNFIVHWTLNSKFQLCFKQMINIKGFIPNLKFLSWCLK